MTYPGCPIVSTLIWILRTVLDGVSDYVFGGIYRNKRISLPPIVDNILLESAVSLAEKIRSGKLKSEAVVKAYISRITAINGVINAVVDERFEEAISEAQNVDYLIASGAKTEEEMKAETPFLGVPFTTKDSHRVKGLHHTGGVINRKDIIADSDAPSVALMKEAGAIILAVTNTSEMAMFWESSNNLHGRTLNPYDTTRMVGGSSGGEAALLAAAGSVIGLGSDIGGSIRMPCFFNGIFGHKPSRGVVSWRGQMSENLGVLSEYLAVGPMCRYAGDMMPIMKIIAKEPDAVNLNLDKPVDMKKLKIYYMEDDGGNPKISSVDPELTQVMHKVLDHFKIQHAIEPSKVSIPELKESLEIWTKLMSAGRVKKFAEQLGGDDGTVKGFTELFKWCFRCSKYTIASILMVLNEQLFSPNPKAVADAQEKCQRLKDKFQQLLVDDVEDGYFPIFLYPSHPRVAPYHDQSIVQIFNFAYTAILNVIGVPVTQCTLGLGKQGLPVGIQLVAGMYQDHISLAVALELEKAFEGWVSPSTIANM